MFVNAFLFLFPKCSLSVHEHGKEHRTLKNLDFEQVSFHFEMETGVAKMEPQ